MSKKKAEKALTAKVMSQVKSSNTWNEHVAGHSTHLWTAGPNQLPVLPVLMKGEKLRNLPKKKAEKVKHLGNQI